MPRIQLLKASGIKAKIIMLSFIGLASLVVLTGVNKYLSASVKANLEVGRQSTAISNDTLQMMLTEESFINTKEETQLTAHQSQAAGLRSAIADLKTGVSDETILPIIAQIISLEQEHTDSFESITGHIRNVDLHKNQIVQTIGQVQSTLEAAVAAIDRQETELNMEGEVLNSATASLRRELKSYLGLWYVKLLNLQNLLLFANIEDYRAKEAELSQRLIKDSKNIGILLKAISEEELSAAWNRATEPLPQIYSLQDKLLTEWQYKNMVMGELRDSGERLQQAAADVGRLTDQAVARSNAFADAMVIVISSAGLFLVLVCSFFIYRAITKPLNIAIEELGEAAASVGSASNQISVSSHTLAEGSSEQAASLEETSSSLEEMASMTRQNAANSGQANSLMDETKAVVERASQSMADLTASMADISSASKETSKIIKTIDEIAFQTNLLALNAAVEAARAGAAGAGFAVVADEVRNLALRAADAAKNTATLIEKTVTRVKDGSGLVDRTAEDFGEVESRANKVSELVSEISAASNEQAQGIEQVNKAVIEMDKVVQQNAANAEESASASQEMTAQAEQMKAVVQSLVVLVKGGSENRPVAGHPRPVKAAGTTPAKTGIAAGKRRAPAAEMIPLEDKAFRNF